jgi:hypothetical protein
VLPPLAFEADVDEDEDEDEDDGTFATSAAPTA